MSLYERICSASYLNAKAIGRTSTLAFGVKSRVCITDIALVYNGISILGESAFEVLNERHYIAIHKTKESWCLNFARLNE